MEKVGKMVFKMKPSKSGINKLPLFCQFRPACKNWGSSDEKFCRTWKFPAKRYMYNFYSTFAREGPLPLPNCFFCYTRPSSRSGLRPTRPPWLILLPRKVFCFTFTPSQVSYSWKKSYLKRSHSLCPLRAQWWSPFFLLTELLLWTVHIKHYYGFIWNLPCPAATPTFFTSLVFQQQDHMRFPFRYCLNFENTDLIFFAIFRKIN